MKNQFDDSDDFGFTMTTQDDMRAEEIDYKQKMYDLYNMIIPLLKNLMKDPEKDIIQWPDRVQKIQKFISKMNKIIGKEE